MSRFALVPLLPLLLASCASQRDAGEALIVTGAVVALATSEAATHGGVGCITTQPGCSGQTSKHAGAAAAGVAAGVALAAAGTALANADDGSDTAPSPAPRTAGRGSSWRLVRPAGSEANTTDDER